MLYTENDYIEINKLRKNFWLKIFTITIAYIASVVICSIARIEIPGYLASVLWAIAVVYLWGMQGSKTRKYYLFLKDIKQGLEKTVTGSVESVSDSITSRDLVDFYTVIFNDDDANPTSPSRKLYFDVSKGIPNFINGERLKITLFGNNIKGFEKI